GMVAGTKPGGWVVIEDTDFGGAMLPATLRYVVPAEHGTLGERMVRAFAALFAAIGPKPVSGPDCPACCARWGWRRGAERHGRFVGGGGNGILDGSGWHICGDT